MTMNPLPPQAYTKETLLKAYNWLTAQHFSIKEMATTPDILVSLYLKATRDGDSALDRPSIQNFKNELRSLAGMMGELDKPVSSSNTSSQATPAMPAMEERSFFTAPPSIASAASSAFAASAPSSASSSHHQSTNAGPNPAPKVAPAKASPASSFNLDAASQMMIQEVKEGFNLSSEMEALRMLIKIGYTHAQTILK